MAWQWVTYLQSNFMSNRGMEKPNDNEQRLTELEIKASFTEDLLDQLNQVVVRQQQQIDALIREIANLRQSTLDGGIGVSRNVRDDMPPHYCTSARASRCIKADANRSGSGWRPIISSTETVRRRSRGSCCGCPIAAQSKDQSTALIKVPATSNTPVCRLLWAKPTSLRPSAFTTSHGDRLPKQAQPTVPTPSASSV
jgi:SlyX protein